jgi:hypothetical protein
MADKMKILVVEDEIPVAPRLQRRQGNFSSPNRQHCISISTNWRGD